VELGLRRGKFDKGFIVAFSFTRGAHEEAARLEGKGLEITLISVEDLLCEYFPDTAGCQNFASIVNI
jgi:hypothetical protein